MTEQPAVAAAVAVSEPAVGGRLLWFALGALVAGAAFVAGFLLR